MIRKYAHGRVLDEESAAVDKTAVKTDAPAWTAKDQAELAEENAK